jgi:hypothetical protein
MGSIGKGKGDGKEEWKEKNGNGVQFIKPKLWLIVQDGHFFATK